VQTDDRHDEVEDLLRQVFDEARRDGRRDLAGVHAAAVAEAARLRRRHRQRVTLGGAGGALVAATVVAAVVLVSGATGPTASHLRPAGPTRPPAATPSSSSGPARVVAPEPKAEPGQAYAIPDVVPNPLPAGVHELALAPSQVQTDTGDIVGLAGSCDWDRGKDMNSRVPVAGRTWRFGSGDFPDNEAVSLGVAGFTTGTGADALRDLRNDASACAVSTDLDPVTWPGREGPEAQLWSAVLRDEVGGTVVLAVRRTGDLLVGATAQTKRLEDARRIATTLVDSAVSALVDQDFAPARGAVLGSSDQPPNTASRPGAPVPTPLRTRPVYRLSGLVPREDQLPEGLRYTEETAGFDSPDIPAVMGAQGCPGGPEDPPAAGAGARPVAGTSQPAWQAGDPRPESAADLTITGWATGTGAERFKDLQENRLACVWAQPQTRVEWPGADPASSWLSRSTVQGLTQYAAARRVGDLIVAVTVRSKDPAQARARATAVVTTMAVVAETSGLPAAEGR
jgi:hypothetical protein